MTIQVIPVPVPSSARTDGFSRPRRAPALPAMHTRAAMRPAPPPRAYMVTPAQKPRMARAAYFPVLPIASAWSADGDTRRRARKGGRVARPSPPTPGARPQREEAGARRRSPAVPHHREEEAEQEGAVRGDEAVEIHRVGAIERGNHLGATGIARASEHVLHVLRGARHLELQQRAHARAGRALAAVRRHPPPEP